MASSIFFIGVGAGRGDLDSFHSKQACSYYERGSTTFDHTRMMHARENMWGYRASHGPGIVP